VPGDVVPGGRLLSWRKEVGVDLAAGADHHPLLHHRHGLGVGEPGPLGPPLEQRASGHVPPGGHGLDPGDVLRGHQDNVLQEPRGVLAAPLQSGQQRRDVVAARHGAQHLEGLVRGDVGRWGDAPRDARQKLGLHPGSGVDARGHPLAQQVAQRGHRLGLPMHLEVRGLARIPGQQRLADHLGLLRRQGKRWDPQVGALLHMLLVLGGEGGEVCGHGLLPVGNPRYQDAHGLLRSRAWRQARRGVSRAPGRVWGVRPCSRRRAASRAPG